MYAFYDKEHVDIVSIFIKQSIKGRYLTFEQPVIHEFKHNCL